MKKFNLELEDETYVAISTIIAVVLCVACMASCEAVTQYAKAKYQNNTTEVGE